MGGSFLPAVAVTACTMLLPTRQTPIFMETNFNPNPIIGPDFCVLPPELDYEGQVTFLEDCTSLNRYEVVPLPGPFAQKLGIHPVVCCPKFLDTNAICFPSDAWCPSYVPPTEPPFVEDQFSGDDEYYQQYDYDIQQNFITELPKMSDQACDTARAPSVTYIPGFNTSATCVTLDSCPEVVDHPQAPQTSIVPCGFNEEKSLMMICCPDQFVVEAKEETQPPRFRARNGRARRCEDKSKLCPNWKSKGGCRLDVDIVISKLDPYNGKVDSKNLFDFMQSSCPETCGWCGRKGCVDEHPQCLEWARTGMCVVNPFFMAHTCRESCGVCGFLSTTNIEEQEVDGLSYTDFTKGNFDCGRYKPLCEINNEPCDVTESEVTTPSPTIPESFFEEPDNSFNLGDFDVFRASDPKDRENGDIFCGATMISDRWVLAASHCYDDFSQAATGAQRKVRINTIRDGTGSKEIVEIKRVYKHPLYNSPQLYNDVAVVELGRRVEYNYAKYGDTPSCIDRGLDKYNKIATVQGYGTTEFGDRGTLLETNVTVIKSDECKDILRSNVSSNIIAKRKITEAIPLGLDYGLICAQGIYNVSKKIFSGACKGDSGGPLTQPSPDDRSTLIGIVSGGIDCGKGYPGWYTRVEYFIDWIQCIIEKAADYNNEKSKVEEACKSVVKDQKCEEVIEDASLFDLRTIAIDKEEFCQKFESGSTV